jgi:hypothetical protein
MGQEELRHQTADRLEQLGQNASRLKAFIGFDGFVDEILHVVGKRDNAQTYQRLPTIRSMGERILGAAGKSTNIELVNQRTKLGGNCPIMANALARFGVQVTCIGALGYPVTHPVFSELAQHAQIHGIAEPGHTLALEFDDGKVMFNKTTQFNELNWPNIQARFGHDKFLAHLAQSDLVAFLNWTMIPHMTALWEHVLAALPQRHNQAPRHTLFFDLADPEKRAPGDILKALDLLGQFKRAFTVILGVNEKEALEIGKVLGLNTADHSPEALATLAQNLQTQLQIDTLVLHRAASAISASEANLATVDGPYTGKPLITTGAGDHFNAGFALGKLLHFENAANLITAVATSGFYVRTGQSPSIADLINLLRNWPHEAKL